MANCLMQCLSWMCATKCNYLFETSLRLTSSIRLGAIRRECVFLGINRLHSLGDNLAKAWLISRDLQDHVTQGGSMTLAISYLRDWTQFREYFGTETWDAKWSYRQWFGIFLWPELKPSAKASGGSTVWLIRLTLVVMTTDNVQFYLQMGSNNCWTSHTSK